jgi:hypothetical protein
MRTDRLTDMTKIIVYFRNFAKAPDTKEENVSINCHKFMCFTKTTVDKDKRPIIFTALLLFGSAYPI